MNKGLELWNSHRPGYDAPKFGRSFNWPQAVAVAATKPPCTGNGPASCMCLSKSACGEGAPAPGSEQLSKGSWRDVCLKIGGYSDK